MAMRGLWCKEPCWECGEEGYATRTIDQDASIPYICEGCEMYQRGYDDGKSAGLEDNQGAFQAGYNAALEQLKLKVEEMNHEQVSAQ